MQAQLRGSIGDYQDSDEDALAKGLEAFETINRVLEDHEEATSPHAPQEAPAPVRAKHAQSWLTLVMISNDAGKGLLLLAAETSVLCQTVHSGS